MDFVLIAVFLIALWGAKFRRTGFFFDTYLSQKQTKCVNGFFVMIVFLRHFKDYITCGRFDGIFWSADKRLEQLLVCTFLFYSGYGIMVSFKNKPGYVRRKLPRRIFSVWFQFALAVCLFAALGLVMGERYGVRRILLSFIAWDAIGNSNWYIFCVLMLYIGTYLAARIAKEKRALTAILVTLFAALYTVMLIFFGKAEYWYSTIFCYPLGLFVGEYQERIESFLKEKGRYRIALALSVLVLIAMYPAARAFSGILSGLVSNVAIADVKALAFTCAVVLITMKWQIGNGVLDKLGTYTFEIYILQRLPMKALSGFSMNKYLYFLLAFAITCVLAVLFKKLTKLLLGCIFYKDRQKAKI